ncbi:MAG: hypothetical protein ABIU09_07695 [Pyrinomonadaceae bacterium]
MRKTINAVSIGCIIAIMFAFNASAQSAADGWGSVEALRARTNLVVETKAGKTIKAKFRNAATGSLQLLKGGKTIELNRNDVAAVYVGRRGSILKGSFIGALAGAGAGVLVGALYTVATKSNGLAAAGGFLYGIPIGAVIGGASAAKTRKGVLIYESR